MIVVTGATGNVGTELVRLLAEAGENVVAVSRRGAEGAAGTTGAVTHHRADIADAAALAPVLAGADALFILLPGTGEGVDVAAILDAARAGGVRHVVLLSSQGAASRPGHATLARAEELVRGSGMTWTILRPGGFASNAYQWAEPVRTGRAMAAPFGDVALPVVDPADIAAVAAAALRDEKHRGRTYTLTGSETVSPRDQARILGDVVGAEVAFTELSREQAYAAMAAFMPVPAVEATLAVLGEPTEYERTPSGDVAEVLGRPAGGFTAWARRNAPAFR